MQINPKTETRNNSFVIAAVTAIALSISAGWAPRAAAQQPTQQAQPLDEIVITGSRIVRRDFEANSPIQTVTAADFETTAAIALEETLNDLPHFTPAQTGYTQIQDGELIDTGATDTSGAATLSLRGLGPNRNLVLLDGYRAMPVNATMSVDINSAIPSAAIDRVEVITGGASSVYGSDAIAGVVNFLLKKDFEGADIDLQYGAMSNGDAEEIRLSSLFGVNAADDRGNVMVGLEFGRRTAVEWQDVDFYQKALVDPTVNGTESWQTDPFFQIDNANPPSGAAIDSIFSAAPPGVVLRNTAGVRTGRVSWNQSDNTLYTGAGVFGNPAPAGPGSAAGRYRYNGPLTVGDFPFRKMSPQGTVEQNIVGHKANVPLERYSVFGNGHYDLTETVSAFGQILNVESNVNQLWQIAPAVAHWGQTIPHGNGVYAPSLAANGTTLPNYLPGGDYGLNCPPTGGCTKSQAFPVSPELAILLDSRANPEATWSMNYHLDFPHHVASIPPRSLDSSTRTNQLLLGLEGDIAAIDGGWDVVVSHGSSLTDIVMTGFVGTESFRAVMQSPNFGVGFYREGNPNPTGGITGAGIATCESGIPVFRDHSLITPDCFEAFLRTTQHQSEMSQDFFEANVQGKVAELPAGEARFAAGMHWRTNDYSYIYDTLNQQTSFLDQSLGNYPGSNTAGEIEVSELYGEILLPLLQGKTGAQHLNLELGYRASDYELQGSVDTYKALIDWGVTDTVRFRGGYQRATRAPNLAEMFQGLTQTFSAGIGDPCGLSSAAAFGANPAVNPNAANTRALCEAAMGAVGAANFYDPATPRPNGFSAFWFVNAFGNPDVQPETATTLTAGVVFQPQSDGAFLNGFSASVDWFSIDIEDMIATEAGSAVYEECLSLDTNPTSDINHSACQRMIRNPATGGLRFTDVSYINTGESTVEGVDLQLNWDTALSDIGMDRIPGFFRVNLLVSTLLDLKTQPDVGQPFIDWKGTLGPDPGTSFNNGAFDYRVFTNFGYSVDPWNFSLRWRHLPSAESVQRAIAGSNPIPFLGVGSYDVFDLSGSRAMGDRFDLRFGVDNLLDEEPAITGAQDSTGGNRPTSGQGTTEAGFYDILGRRLFVGFQMSF